LAKPAQAGIQAVKLFSATCADFNFEDRIPRFSSIATETSANHSADRSGDSGERRKHMKTEECGFLPKAAYAGFAEVSNPTMDK
jgi:hypothetical protein